MKAYQREIFANGETKNTVINVPSPKDFQHKTDYGNFAILITNLSNSRRDYYAVAKLELEKSEVLQGMGYKFESSAKDFNVWRFEGPNARQNAIDAACEFIAGRY